MFSHHQAIVRLVGLALVVGLFSACGPEPTPQVSEISAQPSTTILVGEMASLSLRASGTDLEFEWTADRGSVSSSGGPSAIYTAPDSSGSDTVTVEVTSRGSSTYQNITFEVLPRPTDTPTPTPTSPPTETLTPTPTLTPTITPTPAPPLIEVFPQAEDSEAWAFANDGGEVDARYLGSESCRHSGLYGLRITYEMEGSASGGWGVHWANTPSKSFDVSQFSNLTFWVKGTSGGETFQIGMKDASGYEVKVESGDLVVISGSDWQPVTVPLSRFSNKGVNTTSIENVSFGFNRNHGSGSICIDDMGFE